MKRPELKLAVNLERLIQQRGITYRSLSRKTGVPASTIFNWSTGNKPRNVDDLQVVANYLEVGLSYLLFGTNSSNQEKLPHIGHNRLKGSFEIILIDQGVQIERLEPSEPKES